MDGVQVSADMEAPVTMPTNTTVDEDGGGRRIAPAPFNRPSADLVLRSCDRVDFLVFKWILADASPFFAKMFELPQPPDSGPPTDAPNAPPPQDTASAAPTSRSPVVDLSEDSQTLEVVLRLIYPLSPTPSFSSFEELKPVAAAAHMYQFEHVLGVLAPFLEEFAASCPLRVYAFAVRYGMDALAADAAWQFLGSKDPFVYAPELLDIDGAAYHRLLTYRNRCAAAVCTLRAAHPRTAWPTPPSIPSGWTWIQCDRCVAHLASCGPGLSGGGGAFGFSVARTSCSCTAEWFKQYYTGLMDVLEATPSSDRVEDASSLILDQAVVAAASCCKTCGPLVSSHLRQFAELFEEEVERRLLLINLFDDCTQAGYAEAENAQPGEPEPPVMDTSSAAGVAVQAPQIPQQTPQPVTVSTRLQTVPKGRKKKSRRGV